MTLCPYCGWGLQTKTQFNETQCASRLEAHGCDLNKINVNKYFLRYRPTPRLMPPIVRSVRYQGKEGKGDCREDLIPVW